MNKRTSAYHAFDQKLIYFHDDIELVDILNKSVKALQNPNNKRLFSGLNENIHTHMKRRSNSHKNREIVLKHLKSTVYSSYVKDVYEEVALYFKRILTEVTISVHDRKLPNKEEFLNEILDNYKVNVLAKDIFMQKNWEGVVSYIISLIFQSLENERSTKALIMKINKRLKLDIDEETIDNAMPYLDIRHLLVHTDGVASEEFMKRFPKILIIKETNKVKIDLPLLLNMEKHVKEMVQEFDKKIIEKDLLSNQYIHSNSARVG